MKGYIKPRHVVILLRAFATLILFWAMAGLVAALVGCSYANQQAGEIDARPVFPKIIFDSNIQLGK